MSWLTIGPEGYEGKIVFMGYEGKIVFAACEMQTGSDYHQRGCSGKGWLYSTT